MDTSMGNKSFTIDLNTNPSLHNTNRSLIPHEMLEEELKRMKEENKKLATMLTTLGENYNSLRTNLIELQQKHSTHEEDNNSKLLSRKRKAEDVCCVNNSDINFEEASPKRPREIITTSISTVSVKTTLSDQTSLVKDGYNWRKYGQKVTRDNPSPRAYYKCSFAPTCPVKKKVQRSVKDPSVLVATYEGEHNHPHPSQAETTAPLVNQGVITNPTFFNKFMEDINTSSLQKDLVAKMVPSLSKNPSFAATVAQPSLEYFLEYDLQLLKWVLRG